MSLLRRILRIRIARATRRSLGDMQSAGPTISESKFFQTLSACCDGEIWVLHPGQEPISAAVAIAQRLPSRSTVMTLTLDPSVHGDFACMGLNAGPKITNR